MTINRVDHISLVVEDLAAAMAFFSQLGLEQEGEAAGDGSLKVAHAKCEDAKTLGSTV